MKRYLNVLIFFFFSLDIIAQPLDLIPISITGLPQLGNSKQTVADFDDDLDLDIFISGTDLGGSIQCGLYLNNGGFSFIDAGISIPKLYRGDISIGDYNMDNAIDIAVSGENSLGKRKTYLYKNNKNGTFSAQNVPFAQLSNSSSAWLDVENDGDLDFIISGQDSNNVSKVELYLNNRGNGFIVNTNTGISAIYSGSLAVADFDRNNFPDLVISGINESNNYFSDVFLGNGKGRFIAQSFSLPQVAFSKASTSDFNSDGYPDIVIQGVTQSNSRTSKIYRNNSGLAFVPISTSLPGTDSGTFSWADINNDGSPDLFLAGRTSGANSISEVFTFSGSNLFGSTLLNIEDVSFSDAQWADFDNDLDVDLVISGFSSGGPITYIYENKSTVLNSVPVFAGVKQSQVSEDSVKLSWKPFIDAQTPSNGLTYKVWISLDKNTFSVFTPGSDLATGYNKSNTQGKFLTTTTGWIKNFAEGRYYWSVQAVDAALKASAFTPIDSFAICKKISIGNDTAVCFGKTITLSRGSGTDHTNWLIESIGTVSGNSFTYIHTVTGTQNIILELYKEYGCTLYDSVLISKLDLPIGSLPISYAQCFKEPYTLTQGISSDTVRWNSSQSFLIKNQSFTGIALKKDTLTTKITSRYGCVNYDTVRIDTLTLPRFLLRDTMICKFSPALITLQKPGSIVWYSPQLLSGTGNNFIISKVDTTFQVSAKVTDSLGCQFADTMLVKYHELPIAHAGKDSIVCINSSYQLGEIQTATKGKSPYQYLWNKVNDSLIARPTIVILGDTIFRVRVTDSNGCKDSDTIAVKINPVSEIDAGQDQEICLGDSIKLGGKPTAKNSFFSYSYKWSPANYSLSNPIVFPSTATTYRVVVSSYDCKPDTDYINVTVNALPITKTSADTVTIGNGDEVSVSASGGEHYRWFPDQYLSDKFAQEPFFFPNETSYYFVEVTDSNGCRSTDTVLVQVINRFFIPTLFSPNQDGNNDIFHVYGTGIKELKIRIFDRYNQLVYKSDDLHEMKSEGWNGEQNGKLLPAGAYMWEISGLFYNDKPVTYEGKVRGIVNLMR